VAKKQQAFVDSCVLLDIFNDDDDWYEWSSSTLSTLSQDHELVINIIVFTEVAFNFNSHARLEKELALLGISILDIPTEVAFNVSRTFKQYRKNKVDKRSPMPDFYIGEHAKHLGVPLVTRDTARYKTYQPKLKLIAPSNKG
jgi:hypothetical protein